MVATGQKAAGSSRRRRSRSGEKRRGRSPLQQPGGRSHSKFPVRDSSDESGRSTAARTARPRFVGPTAYPQCAPMRKGQKMNFVDEHDKIQTKALSTDEDMDRVILALHSMTEVLQNHAGIIDALKDRQQKTEFHIFQTEAQLKQLNEMKDVIADNDKLLKATVEANDTRIKEVIEQNAKIATHQTLEGAGKMWLAMAQESEFVKGQFQLVTDRMNALEKTANESHQELRRTVKEVERDMATAASAPAPTTRTATAPTSSAAGPAPSASTSATTPTGCQATDEEFTKLWWELHRMAQETRDQFNVVDLSISGMGCPCISGQCPCPCRGKGEGPKESSAGQAPCGNERSGAPDPLPDAWANSNTFRTPRKPRGVPQGPGGGGGGDGGGGDDGPGHGAQQYDIGTPHQGGARGPKRVDFGRLFEAKEAKILPQYNGKDKGTFWRKKVSFYLASRCPEITAILQWAERSEGEIDEDRLANYGHMGEEDAGVLGQHLWGFLNLNLTDEAWEVFENVPHGNGFEAWRRVLKDVVQKTRAEKIRLERTVLNPPACSSVEQIPMALERWETSHKSYKEAGGKPVDDERKKGAIISMLPWSLQEKVLWDFDDHKTADSLVSWLKAKVRVTSSWKVGGKEVHNLAEEHEDLRQEMLAIGIHLDDDQLFALANSRAGRHGGRPGGRPGPRAMPGSDRGPPRAPLGSDRGPPRSKADITCANCLGKGHTAMECKKEKVQRADRLCFQCGKPGHEARRCPEKSAKPAQSLEEATR